MTYNQICEILGKKYKRWTIVEDCKEHSITFYLPGKEVDYFVGVELEIRRPVSILFKAKKLYWWQNRWITRKFICINQGMAF